MESLRNNAIRKGSESQKKLHEYFRKYHQTFKGKLPKSSHDSDNIIYSELQKILDDGGHIRRQVL